MRSKLQGPLNPFASPAESESLLQLLDVTEEWLYGDGESLKRHVYVEKLAELRSKGDPIVHRANEHLNRPLAVDNFNRSLVVSYLISVYMLHCNPFIKPAASNTI